MKKYIKARSIKFNKPNRRCGGLRRDSHIMYEAMGIASPPVINFGGPEDLFVAQSRVLENASLRLDHLKTRHQPFWPTVIMNHQPSGYSFSSVWRATLSISLSPPGSEEALAISMATVETSAWCHHDQFLAARREKCIPHALGTHVTVAALQWGK